VFDESAARQAFERAIGHASKLDGQPALRLLGEFQSQIAVVETEELAICSPTSGGVQRAISKVEPALR